jgi:hypothetical protein
MQPLSEIEEAYKTPDPWGFRTNSDDAIRKQAIIEACKYIRADYDKALEIGAGEGFITEDLPARKKYGFEVSKLARSRMSKNVVPLDFIQSYEIFDLVVVPGVLYGHYDCEKFYDIVDKHSNDVVVTCNIKAWEDKRMENPKWLFDRMRIKQIESWEFPYREFTQKLRLLRRV